MSLDELTAKGRRTRRSILSSAKRVFADSGYSQARMTDIAEGADISSGAVYRYFDDKDDIFRELFEDLHARFLEVTAADVVPDNLSDLRRAVREANLRYFELYAKERGFMRAVVEASAVSDRYMSLWSAMYDEIAERFLRRLRHTYADIEGLDSGGLTDSVFALVCMTEQVAYVNFTRRVDSVSVEPNRLAEVVTDIWWQSIAPEEKVAVHVEDSSRAPEVAPS